MADDQAQDLLTLSPRDIANALSGGLADLTTYIRVADVIDPRFIISEMERLAVTFAQRLPVPQGMGQQDSAESRPN